MRPAASPRPEESGATIVFIAITLFVILTVGALAYDLGNLWAVRADLQKAADNSATSAIWELPDEAAVISAAIAYGDANHPNQSPVVTAAEVEIGHWDSSAEVFIPAGTPRDAVRVTARRAEEKGNPVPLYLARFMGL